MSYFAHQSAAQRYAQSRPYFHPLVIEKIRAYLRLTEPLAQVLDVGCGTGQSTVALKAIATAMVGVDLSPAMLAEATPDPAIRYLVAPAEEIPLPSGSCDLLTTSLAFHWFDQERFLTEAQRLLKPQGWLVIYNNGFGGQMVENSSFAEWNLTRYLARYPSPPRNQEPLTPEIAQRFDLCFAYHEEYRNEVSFTVEMLAAYLTTQSNVIAAVEQGRESVAEVYDWLVAEMHPLFSVSPATFRFGGPIWYLQKVSE